MVHLFKSLSRKLVKVCDLIMYVCWQHFILALWFVTLQVGYINCIEFNTYKLFKMTIEHLSQITSTSTPTVRDGLQRFYSIKLPTMTVEHSTLNRSTSKP